MNLPSYVQTYNIINAFSGTKRVYKVWVEIYFSTCSSSAKCNIGVLCNVLRS